MALYYKGVALVRLDQREAAEAAFRESWKVARFERAKRRLADGARSAHRALLNAVRGWEAAERGAVRFVSGDWASVSAKLTDEHIAQLLR